MNIEKTGDPVVIGSAPTQDKLTDWLKPAATSLPNTPNIDVSGAIKLGLWLLCFGFGGFLLWAGLAPIDEGVPANGVVSVDSKRKHIDHLMGGLVEKIAVRDGQKVKEGDTLITLNPVQTRAAFNTVRGQWLIAAATVARLEAERAGAGSIRFPKELLASEAPEEALSAMRSQEHVFRARRSELDGQLRILRESVRGLEGQLASLEQLKVGRERQVTLFNAQLDKFQSLNKQGFISQNQLLDMERQLAELQSKQSDDMATLGGVNARLAEYRMRDNQRLNEFRREVETQLADVQRDESALADRLFALRDSHERLVIRAPVSGTVVDLAVNTVGGVVKPGDRLLDIVPDSDDLVIEAQLAPQHVDRMRAGLPADIHFDAYVSMVRRPMVSGNVSVVSADALTDPRSGEKYYAMRVKIPVHELAALGAIRLQPGMLCSVTVKTGERTLLAYLIRPLIRRFSGALNEA
jgi:protease secretion system membrane fusion protein